MHTRTKTGILAALGAALALAAGGPGVAVAAPAIPLNNGQETTGADTGASGFFSYQIDGDQLCYTLSARNLSADAIAAHVHIGPRKVAGPVVIPLMVGVGTAWSVSDCTTVDPVLLDAIEADPGAYYVNVHTPMFPGGEIRGHLK
ncbi:MAG TPA: CHRD domain-containing protein [Terrimesophilobacter sp.]|jgi:CHRD domain.|uniref:CHRD domain-containing protein n=1 Tax=Terrimesophilobacter sp. TaxID=2906435 RepID=UPI002F939331